MQVFVTGATGVIGRRVVPALRARGHEVTAAIRSAIGPRTHVPDGVRTVALDLFDAKAVRQAIAGQDVVINLATHVPPTSLAFLPGAWRQMSRIRRDASRILTNAAATTGVQRFIQESFAAIYPDNGDRWVTEAVVPQPAHYCRSALDAEAAAMHFAKEGRAGVALRFSYLYGPNDGFTRQLASFVRNGWLPLLGRREAYFPMVIHDDAAAAVVAAIEIPSGIYNVVDDQPMTHAAIGLALANILSVRPPRFPPPWAVTLTGSLGETLARSLRISNAKLKGASSWRPSAPNAADGLRRALLETSRR
ncbi:MAG TPA: NAD(P)-dependent oxidoreductase [Gemmatimonadaceae bacterium]|nr:NAD(P)-dependent oxidoreductase [Gemmatimonadaceae bacterium]